MAPKRSAEGSPTGCKKAKTTKPASPKRNAEGKGFYLLKHQIDVLPISRFRKAPNKTLPITNIRSAQARKTIRSMQEGDKVLFYSCSNLKTKAKVDAGVYGCCIVVRAPYPDPADDKWLPFDLRLDEAFDGGSNFQRRRRTGNLVRGHEAVCCNVCRPAAGVTCAAGG